MVPTFEFTVPWEMDIPKKHEYKFNKFADCSPNIRQKGYVCHFYMVQVGAKDVTAKSQYTLPKDLGLPRRTVNS